MKNNQFGVYVAYANANVTSTAVWTASQSSTPSDARFVAQADRNLVVYSSTSSPSAIWAAHVALPGTNSAYCLEMLDNGNLIWKDYSNNIIWQTNSSG